MSLVVHDSVLSDSDESQERCFPMSGPDDWSSIPAGVRRNRDYADLLWALVCRNCSYAVDPDGFCYCTHHASDEHENIEESSNSTSVSEVPPKKRTLEAVYDLTTPGKPKVIDFLKGKKK